MNVLIKVFSLFALLTCALADNNAKFNFTMEKVEGTIKLCQIRTNASDADMDYALKDKIPETKVQSCVTSCFGMELGLMNKNGTINIDAVIALIQFFKKGEVEKDVIKKTSDALDFCNKQQPAVKDECEGAKQYYICYIKKAKETGVPLDE